MAKANALLSSIADAPGFVSFNPCNQEEIINDVGIDKTMTQSS